MSLKIPLADQLLASAPLAGIADNDPSDRSDAAVEKKSDVRSRKSMRESSDIILSKEEPRGQREERRRPYEDYVRNRGKSDDQRVPNLSPDD